MAGVLVLASAGSMVLMTVKVAAQAGAARSEAAAAVRAMRHGVLVLHDERRECLFRSYGFQSVAPWRGGRVVGSSC
ncbi:MAG: hypothetical protein R3E52_07075 [Burkholderiaceae bacterium]